MKIQVTWLLLLLGAVIFTTTEARRVRVRPVQQEDDDEEDSGQYYSVDPVAQQQQRVVLVSSADQYNGLYGQPTASPRQAQDNYIPSSRQALAAAKASAIQARTKDVVKAPTVQTIRNYNKVNDDGSFTFGYESADGSFKEETRGTDCVVRGKYGYVDPDGNKREFTYVSGNPCDPNAPNEEEQDEAQENESAEDSASPNYPVQANYPTRPVRPIRPVTVAPKPALTYYQNNYEEERSEEEQPEPEQVLRQQPIRRPTYISRPQYVQQPVESQVYQQRPQYLASTTPASLIYKQTLAPISITPRPVSPTPTPKSELPATTYRPQLLQLAVTPRPSFLYTKQLPTALRSTTQSPLSSSLSFESEYQKFQQDNTISPTPASVIRPTPKILSRPSTSTTSPVYSSAIVFDPSSGQYKTQLYQSLPQTQGDFTLNQRLQPYVHQPSRQPVINIQQLQQRSPLYTPYRSPPSPSSLSSLPRQSNPQAAYQQQQADLQFQNSAQLYAQQQKARAQQQQQQQQQQHQHKQASQVQTQPQALYYVQPSVDQSQALAAGQIDAFLRGHNIQF